MPGALIYFMHNPMPPRSGAHRRCLQMLSGLREAGYSVTLASSTLHTETPWSSQAVSGLREAGIEDVEVFDRGSWDRGCDALARRWDRLTRAPLHTQLPEVACPSSLKVWFHRLAEKVSPDVLLMNYCWFDSLVRHRMAPREIIETHDIITVNSALRRTVQQMLVDYENGTVDPRLFDVQFMAAITPAPAAEEMDIYARYDDVIAISPAEESLLRSRLPHTRVRCIPVSDTPRWVDNTYDGPLVITAGPNPFNSQACLYFAEKVWPLVVKQHPSARAVIAGTAALSNGVRGSGLQTLGFVEDLTSLYAAAPMVVSAVFVGTGQQIKVVEALAHGVPVVALKSKTLSHLLVDGETGFIVSSAEETASRIVQLFRDRSLCSRLGSEGRSRVAADAAAQKGLPALFG